MDWRAAYSRIAVERIRGLVKANADDIRVISTEATAHCVNGLAQGACAVRANAETRGVDEIDQQGFAAKVRQETAWPSWSNRV